MKENYTKHVRIYCPLCGGTTFIFDETNEDTDYTCIQCKKVSTREDIEAANQENLYINFEELKKEAFADIEKDLQNIFKNKK